MKVRRLFTENDMVAAFINGFVKGWVRTCPGTDAKAIGKLFEQWMETKYPEGCEAELRAEGMVPQDEDEARDCGGRNDRGETKRD